ncbi:hypothetical protein M3Y98_00190500 [Aphelenchoides besseyi]|nr:hypothetical protein M3Y98_00190500 [Aphelenchoides besseyi]
MQTLGTMKTPSIAKNVSEFVKEEFGIDFPIDPEDLSFDRFSLYTIEELKCFGFTDAHSHSGKHEAPSTFKLETDEDVTKLLSSNNAKQIDGIIDYLPHPSPTKMEQANTKELSIHSLVFLGFDNQVNQWIANNPKNVNVTEVEDWTPLHFAMAIGCTDIAVQLVDSGANMHAQTRTGETPIMLGAKWGHRNTMGRVCLRLEEMYEKAELEKLINFYDSNNRQPIHHATEARHFEAVDVLLMFGGDPNTKDKNGETALFIACKNGDMTTIDSLLHNKYDESKTLHIYLFSCSSPRVYLAFCQQFGVDYWVPSIHSKEQCRLQALKMENLKALMSIIHFNHFIQLIQRSADEKLELVPVEELIAEAPKIGMELDETIKSDAHKLRMARLNFELKQREHEWYPSDLLSCSCDGDENAVVAFEIRQRNGNLDKMNNIIQENRMETDEMSEDVVQTIEQVRVRLLEPHPMTLIITIPCNGTELFSSQHLFDDLYYEDAGESCPNEVGNLLLDLCETSIKDHINSIGKMYSFVQALVGTPNEAEKSLPQFQRVSAFVRTARQRLFDRYELSKTLQLLESTSYEKAFPTEHVQKYSNRHQPRMSSFTIDYNPSISTFPQKNRWKFTPTPNDSADEKLARGFLLQFNVECTPLSLNVLIFIPYAYPRVYSTVLFIFRNKPISSQLANALKDFEKAVNLRIPPKAKEVGVDIVTFQIATILHRLPVVFDWEKENGTEIRISGRLHAPTLSRILCNR